MDGFFRCSDSAVLFKRELRKILGQDSQKTWGPTWHLCPSLPFAGEKRRKGLAWRALRELDLGVSDAPRSQATRNGVGWAIRAAAAI